MKKKYTIEVDCANCAAKMEEHINKMEEVKNATINFMMSKLIVEFHDNIEEKDVITKIEKICKKIDSDFEINK